MVDPIPIPAHLSLHRVVLEVSHEAFSIEISPARLATSEGVVMLPWNTTRAHQERRRDRPVEAAATSANTQGANA
jgi:hypothetical protein